MSADPAQAWTWTDDQWACIVNAAREASRMTAMRQVGLHECDGRSTASRQRDAVAAVRLYAAIAEVPHFGALCGGCHQNGVAPPMLLWQCEVCERTRSEVVRAHGLCELAGDRQGDKMLLAGILRSARLC